jgi:hypothetical protein
MSHVRLLLSAVVLTSSSLAMADQGATVVRLSQAEAEAAKEAAAKRNLASQLGNDASSILNDKRDFFGPVHGEVGFGIGTGGYREAFGTAVMPLGDDGLFAFSFDSVQFNGRRRDRR